ncbi:MAG: YceI family protein [Ferruginibacter sp.]|nr:YceI family protein [Ferruginibacter sp.]
MDTQTFKLATAQSEIAWIGRKVTGAHNGTIAIEKGWLNFSNDQLVGGQFIIDTTSINILDISDPATNAQFAGHLASDDFFSSAKYPTASFEIVSAKQKTGGNYDITGNLTIKDITYPVNFDATIVNDGQTVNASGKIVVNRTLFDMKFRSGNFFLNLGDTLIYNEFDLNVHITAKAVNTAVLA